MSWVEKWGMDAIRRRVLSSRAILKNAVPEPQDVIAAVTNYGKYRKEFPNLHHFLYDSDRLLHRAFLIIWSVSLVLKKLHPRV
jgi:hypothetical protein